MPSPPSAEAGPDAAPDPRADAALERALRRREQQLRWVGLLVAVAVLLTMAARVAQGWNNLRDEAQEHARLHATALASLVEARLDRAEAATQALAAAWPAGTADAPALP
ncbi:hypothetical protein, partial [Pseudacidovorax intermedius]